MIVMVHANYSIRPWSLIYHLAITPYLVLNVHWARLLICPSERRRKKEERERETKEQRERGRKGRKEGRKMSRKRQQKM